MPPHYTSLVNCQVDEFCAMNKAFPQVLAAKNISNKIVTEGGKSSDVGPSEPALTIQEGNNSNPTANV